MLFDCHSSQPVTSTHRMAGTEIVIPLVDVFAYWRKEYGGLQVASGAAAEGAGAGELQAEAVGGGAEPG